MCRNTPTRTSVRLAADPHAAKHATIMMKGTVRPGYTRRLFLVPVTGSGVITVGRSMRIPPANRRLARVMRLFEASAAPRASPFGGPAPGRGSPLVEQPQVRRLPEQVLEDAVALGVVRLLHVL